MFRFSAHFFFLYTSWAAVVPYLAYLLAAQGFDKAQIGLLTAGWDFSAIIGGLALGHLADHWGKRRLLIGLAMAVGTLAFVPLSLTHSFAAAMALMLLAGLSFRATQPLADALAIGELPHPTSQYGLTRAWGTIGFIVLLVIVRAGKLTDESNSLSMLRFILLTGAATIVATFFLPNRRRGSAGQTVLSDGRGFDAGFWLWMTAAAFSAFAQAAHYTFLPLYLKDVLHMQQGAWVWAVGATAELPIILLGGYIIGRAGLRAMLIVGLLAITVRLGSYVLFHSQAVVVAVQCLHALGFGALHVATIEFIHRRTPPHRWSLAMAIYASIGMGLPRVLGNALGGYLVEHFGYDVLFGTYALLPLAAVAMVVAGRKKLLIERP